MSIIATNTNMIQQTTTVSTASNKWWERFDTRYLFWGFFLVILGFSVPHMAYAIGATFHDDTWNTLFAYAFATIVELVIFCLTRACFKLAHDGSARGRRLTYYGLITLLSAWSAYLNIQYNLAFYHPQALQGASGMPGFALLPYLMGCLPFLNIIVASMSTIMGVPAAPDTRTAEEMSKDYDEEQKKERLRTAYAVEQAALRGQRLRGTIEGYTGLSFSRRKEAPTQQEQPSPTLLGSEHIAALPSRASEVSQATEEETDPQGQGQGPTTGPILNAIHLVPPFDLRKEENIVEHGGKLVRVHTVETASRLWGIPRSLIEETHLPFTFMRGKVPTKVIPVESHERVRRYARSKGYGSSGGRSVAARTKEKESMTQVLEGVGG